MGELIEFKRKTIGRNDSCHCGSGTKYKKCCLRKDEELELARRYEPNAEQSNDFNNYINSRAYRAHRYVVMKYYFPLDHLVRHRIETLRAELAQEQEHNNEIDEDDSVEFVIAVKSNDGKPITEGVERAIKKYEQRGQTRDAMNGLKRGDEKELRLLFPHDHKNKLLKGRDISVRIKILRTKSWVEVSQGYLAEQLGYDSREEMQDDIEMDLKAALEIEGVLFMGSQIVSQIISSGNRNMLDDESALRAYKGILRQELGDDFVDEFKDEGDEGFKKYVQAMMEHALVPLIVKAEGLKLSAAGQTDNIRRYELFLNIMEENLGTESEKKQAMKSLMGRYVLYKHLLETLDIEYTTPLVDETLIIDEI